jgi:hypothetical protein
MRVLVTSLTMLAIGIYAGSLRGDDLVQGSKAESVAVSESGNTLTLSNRFVTLTFDFSKRSYSVSDVVSKEVVLDNAWLSADGFAGANIPLRNCPASVAEKEIITYALEPVNDDMGQGMRMVVTVENRAIPATSAYLFAYTLYAEKSMVVMRCGMHNTRDYDLRLMTSSPMTNATLYPGQKFENPQTLNGSAGSEAAKVLPGMKRNSANSLMLTGMVRGKRRTVVWGGLAYRDFAAYATVQDGIMKVESSDPVGRLVKSGETYWAGDTLYLDVATSDPFLALEKYGLALRQANHAHPNVYDFPMLCGWSVGALSHLEDINTSAKLVGELEAAQKAGMTKYTKVGILLVPDTYCYEGGNTEQGWWDDAHWAKYGHLVPPYDTFAKWCAAFRKRDGIPYTYFQLGMPSDDYARAFPDHILSKDISRLAVRHRHHQPLVSYDYTSADFQKRTLAMWQRLRQDGIRGIFFDYPETGWRPEGGFEDKRATTTSAYRRAFQLCRDGLGAEGFIDERNLGESGRPRLDVTAGIVDTQRNWTDTNRYVPEMVTVGGLRWYKNRTVFNYYPCTKTVHDCSPEIRQSMLTMIFLTSGRIELATSYTLFTPEITHDLSRIYPVYREPHTARPVDAFTGVSNPQVYDLALTPNWHQVALYNTQGKPGVVSTSLSGEVVSGAIGLDPSASYYAYDFWNDTLLGKLPGTAKLEKQLNPNCCAMVSIRKVSPNPQVISTNRHVLQGWVELADVEWMEADKKLVGVAKVVGSDPLRIVLAGNGRRTIRASATGAQAKLEAHPAGPGYVTLVLDRPDTGETTWHVDYE